MAAPLPNGRLDISTVVVRWFLVTIVILGGIGLITYRCIQGLVDTSSSVVHTQQVLSELHDIASQLNQIHAAQRGYLLTGQQQFLSPYHKGLSEIADTLRRVQQLLADNPSQLERFETLQRDVKIRLSNAARVIDTYDNEGLETATQVLRNPENKQELHKILDIIDEMESHEQHLLEDRAVAAKYSANMALSAGVLGLGCCVVILALVFWLIWAEGIRRQNTEASLLEANERKEASFKRLERLTEESTLITTMGDYMQTCRSPDDAYSILGRTLPKLLPNISGAIGIISNSRNLVEMVLTWGEKGIFTHEFHPDECWGLRRGRLHHVSDVNGSHPLCNHLESANPPGYLCLPMVAHGETVGLLCLSTSRKGGLDEGERATARAVAEQASLALANLKLQEALRVQSIRDPLTGLFNRRYLEASLEREVLRAKRHRQQIAVVMIDIDHFKRFNDTYGHDGGDSLLSEFGKMISRHIRGEDVPCRFGGEEFCLLLPGATMEVAQHRAEEIREAIKRMVIRHGKSILGAVTLSAGVAVYPNHGDSGLEVMAAADKALYQAKHAGRDQVMVCEVEQKPMTTEEAEDPHLNGSMTKEYAVL